MALPKEPGEPIEPEKLGELEEPEEQVISYLHVACKFVCEAGAGHVAKGI